MRKELHSIVTSGNMLLHGSPSHFAEIFPHYTDDEMAICGTPCPELAITMAILRACAADGHKTYDALLTKKKCTLQVTVCEKVLSELLHKKLIGYVHVIDAAHFSRRDNFEYRAYDSLYVQQSLKVTNEDLPFMPVNGQLVYRIPVDRKLVTIVN